MAGTLRETLQSLREAGGFDMVAVVGADGLPIEATHAPEIDADSLAALAASGLLMMDAVGQELGQGPALQAILEYQQSLVILEPVERDLVLMAVAHGEANLGRVRLVLRRAQPDVLDAVQAL